MSFFLKNGLFYYLWQKYLDLSLQTLYFFVLVFCLMHVLHFSLITMQRNLHCAAVGQTSCVLLLALLLLIRRDSSKALSSSGWVWDSCYPDDFRCPQPIVLRDRCPRPIETQDWIWGKYRRNAVHPALSLHGMKFQLVHVVHINIHHTISCDTQVTINKGLKITFKEKNFFYFFNKFYSKINKNI